MKPKRVGIFPAGYSNVCLFLREGAGGNYDLFPGDEMFPEIYVGFDEEKDRMFYNLHHEIFELMCCMRKCKYSQAGEFARDNGAVSIFMTHTEFSDISACVADFILSCMVAFNAKIDEV